MKRAIMEGHVFIAQPPLYQVTRMTRYAFSEEERDLFIELRGGSETAKIGVQRTRVWVK